MYGYNTQRRLCAATVCVLFIVPQSWAVAQELEYDSDHEDAPGLAAIGLAYERADTAYAVQWFSEFNVAERLDFSIAVEQGNEDTHDEAVDLREISFSVDWEIWQFPYDISLSLGLETARQRETTRQTPSIQTDGLTSVDEDDAEADEAEDNVSDDNDVDQDEAADRTQSETERSRKHVTTLSLQWEANPRINLQLEVDHERFHDDESSGSKNSFTYTLEAYVTEEILFSISATSDREPVSSTSYELAVESEIFHAWTLVISREFKRDESDETRVGVVRQFN